MDPPDFVPISQSQRADGSASSSPPAGSGAAVQIAPESEGPATATDLPSPGLNVPGSFPLDTEDPKSSRTPESSQGIDGLQSDIDRAMDGIPEDIAKAAQSIMQAASQYLPASVADTVSGFLSKGDGASASPRADENGAAEVLGHSTAAEDVDATAAAGGPGSTPTAGMSESKLAAPAQLPSIERQTEGKPAAGRVDEASTKESTTDISFVPRVTPEAMVSESIAGPKAQEQTAESLDQAQRQDGTMAKPNDHGDLPHAAIDKLEPQPSALGQPSNDASMATSERLSTTKDLDEHPMAPKAEKDQAQSVTSKDQGSMATRSTASVAASSKGGSTIPSSSSKRSLPTKSKLVDRVKGEMKILSGKLGGDKAKIEEGRKLKSGGH